MGDDFRRQDLLVTQEQLRFPITLVGAGGIGSPTALAIAKLGCRRLTVFDPDLVADHNVANQLYGPDDVGRAKADALGDLLERLCGYRPECIANVLPDGPRPGVTILAVDSMASRRAIWESSVRYQPAVALLVDARMGGEVGRLLVISPTDPDDVAFYESTLHSDEEATLDPCLDQSVAYSTLVIAGFVAATVRRYAVGETSRAETIVDLATSTLLSRSALGTIHD